MTKFQRFLDSFRRPMADGLSLYGHFGMKVYDVKNGKKTLLRQITKRNQITNTGRLIVLELLRQSPTGTLPQQNPNYNQLWSISAGTNGTIPSVSDTALYDPAPPWTGEFLSDAECQVVTTPNLEIQISKVMLESEAVGVTLREAGIFTRGIADDPTSPPGYPSWPSIPYRRMYARQVHPAIIKADTMTIEYVWLLGVTIQGGP